MENEPTDGDEDDSHPKAGRRQRISYPIPIIDIKVFVGFSEKIEQRPSQNGGYPIRKKIQICQLFLVHNGR
jgi:hypothetical protein